MTDPIKELSDILDAVGTRWTFDKGRTWKNPCTFCGKSDTPRELVTIGRYGSGDDLTRPVCERCKRLGEAANAALKQAPRWLPRLPTAAEVETHARAHLIRDREGFFGLWSRLRAGHAEPVYVALRCCEGHVETADGSRLDIIYSGGGSGRWLPCTAQGTPVGVEIGEGE